MEKKDLLKNVIAHRGVHDENILENSLKAFEQALKSNYIIELDVRLTKDNKVLVFHDDDLKRLFNVDKKVSDLTYSEIKKISSDIVLLEDVLFLVNNRVLLLIELKSYKFSYKLEKELMKVLSNYKNYAIQSFNPLTLIWFKKNYPSVLRGQLSCDFKCTFIKFFKSVILKNMLFNRFSKPDFISYKYSDLSNDRIKKLKKKYLLIGWTIKNKKEYLRQKDKYDNLICENFI